MLLSFFLVFVSYYFFPPLSPLLLCRLLCLSHPPPSLSLHWHMHECVQVCAHVHASALISVSLCGVQRLMLGASPRCSPLHMFKAGSQTEPKVHLLGHSVSQFWTLGYDTVCDFRSGSGDLNSAPHDHIASTLAMEPSLPVLSPVIRMFVVP